MRTLGQFVGILLVIGFVGAYFWWIIAAAPVGGLVWLAVRGYHAAQADALADARRRAAMAARADQQHAWVMVGDDRGVYGTVGTELMRNMSTV